MKAVGRRRALPDVAAYALVLLSLWCLIGVGLGAHVGPPSPLGPSERPEAYLNGSSYIRLTRPVSLRHLVGLSYRTCVGGELFSQRYSGHTLQVSALLRQVVVSWARPSEPRREAALPVDTLDNRWHWLALRYSPHPPQLRLQLDKDEQVIANLTWNSELLAGGVLESGGSGAVVLVGNLFSGCVREGPQLEFHAHSSAPHHVLFGACPLATDHCQERVEVLREPPKDHCYNEPCMRHGTCISRHDRYECQCTARYTGNNCEVDAGDPCRSAPCQHGGRCVEDPRGDYTCQCDHHYHGVHCELEVSVDPRCSGTPTGPCLHNGSCSVPHPHGDYVCTCQPGYTGRNCETDIDECSLAGASACLHGGVCRDGRDNYTCDCTDTGYTGGRCESNVNECLVEGVCGHGVCYDTYGSFVCACLPLYTGERCQQMSACASGPCGVGGVCVEEDNGAGYRCVCGKGWAPPHCREREREIDSDTDTHRDGETDRDGCSAVRCPRHSHCTDDKGIPAMVTGVVISKQVTCVCDVGYFGAPGPSPNCTTIDSACDSGACQHGASCLRTKDGVRCICPPHYTGMYCEHEQTIAPPSIPAQTPPSSLGSGKALQELKAERCASQPCLHAKHCHDQGSGGFQCTCEAGWSGLRCDAPLALTLREDEPADCREAGCLPHQECTEASPGIWRCAIPAVQSACASSPCHNGTCLQLDGGLVRCQCPPGNNGRFCELDIDECQLMPKVCNHGVCVNVPGSYQCYCRPGYTGDSCEQDIDECLSAPCRNGGTCRDRENNYECACPPGFTGKDCSVNIDECATNPCLGGGTCVDGVAAYSCLCPAGLTGARCEQDIDDCESSPCLHGGRCTDALNGYSCDCTGTGYTGPGCDTNIDECAHSPCLHGGLCQDRVNEYLCVCEHGYTGKNCESDIMECASSPCQFGGVCLERSNASLYRPGLEPETDPLPPLPLHFYQPFSYANASGYDCVCVPGTVGARCEVNIDECASSPCGHGKCIDGLGTYHCECLQGYEGDHCQIEIDECQRYSPCQHGRCYDGRASYYCSCEAGWGGVNCSVVLTGCKEQPCRHRGQCRPWLHNETQHRFNCSCQQGYYGTTCEKITTMSLEKTSYAEVNTSREEGYDISFRFKTTLGSGLLAMGRGLTYFFLELSHGRLNLHSSLLNKWEGVFIGSNLNDSNWQKVFVTINASHLVLAANEEQTIYPISQNEAFNASVTSFPVTRLGAPGSSYAPLTHGPHHFVGCFQDVVVNNQWVLPEDSNATSSESLSSDEDIDAAESSGSSVALVSLMGVSASCSRTPQCSPSPCSNGGHCEDLWSAFRCTCPRPHLGHTCQSTYTAATFGHETATSHSVVSVAVTEGARRAVHAALDISMFIRTRKPEGMIFYLGSMPKYGQTDETLVGASLKGGELLVHLRFNDTPEQYTVGGTRLDNGYLHLIQVVRNSTLVQVKLNGTEYFRKSISAAKQLDAQVLYLGGPPPIPPPPLTTTTPQPSPQSPPQSQSTPPQSQSQSQPTPTQSQSQPPPQPQYDDKDYFKGVIQDVQVSNGMNVTVVEFFPLEVPGLEIPPPFGSVTLDPAGVLRGVVSDDACASRPCLHNATCELTWNDYQCVCPRGYKGKQCAEVEFCQLQACPLSAHCRNLDGGYECVSNATFDGVNTTLSYRLRVPPSTALGPPLELPTSLTITYRSKVGGTLLYATGMGLDGSEQWFTVGLWAGQLAAGWKLGKGLPALKRMRPSGADHQLWTTARFTLHGEGDATTFSGAFVESEGHEEVGFTAAIDGAAWQRLMTTGDIHLGGLRRTSRPAHITAAPISTTGAISSAHTDSDVYEYVEGDDVLGDNLVGEYFKGCMGAVHIGNLLLPFFTEEQLLVGGAASLLAASPRYALVEGAPWGAAAGLGCLLCLEGHCLMGGRCADVRTSYACLCPAGYSGDQCEQDVDECEHHRCARGATCVDGVAQYTCLCPPGYDGDLCEHDIDECASSPCLNGGSCSEVEVEAGMEYGLGYRCSCTAGFTGQRCERARHADCTMGPCQPDRGRCRDVKDPVRGNNYTCDCLTGYAGVHCEEAFCQNSEPCLHGVCRTELNPPLCECLPGYTGRRCELERDPCLAEDGGSVCAHGGKCTSRHPEYECDCSHTGWRGLRCETDVDECAEGLVSCGPGECVNTPGSYTCLCGPGFCGNECALRDPCAVPTAAAGSSDPTAPTNSSASETATGTGTGPCQHGAVCEQRCNHGVDYHCYCVDGWGGKNCSQQIVSEGAAGGVSRSSSYLIGFGAALLALAIAGAAAGALGAQARRKRATRGTYSPSGQEYCNPRAEMMQHALKPPPEERLI